MYVLVFNYTLEEYEVLSRQEYNSTAKRMQDLQYIKHSDSFDYLCAEMEQYETYY